MGNAHRRNQKLRKLQSCCRGGWSPLVRIYVQQVPRQNVFWVDSFIKIMMFSHRQRFPEIQLCTCIAEATLFDALSPNSEKWRKNKTNYKLTGALRCRQKEKEVKVQGVKARGSDANFLAKDTRELSRKLSHCEEREKLKLSRATQKGLRFKIRACGTILILRSPAPTPERNQNEKPEIPNNPHHFNRTNCTGTITAHRYIAVAKRRTGDSAVPQNFAKKNE